MEFDYIAFILLVLYLFLFVLEVKQLVDVFWVKNKIINYRNGIISTLVLGSLLRVIFWTKVLLPTTVHSNFMMVLFYLPIWLNFAGLSLLSVFYANALLNGQYKNIPLRLCIVANLIFFFLNISIGCLMTESQAPGEEDNTLYDLFIVYAVFLDTLTALLVGYFGHFFVVQSHTSRNWILPRPVEQFALVNWIIVFCFLIRSLFVILLASDGIHSTAEVNYNGAHPPTSVTILVFYVLTEWIPNSSMLYLLWKSPTRSKKQKYFESEDESEIFCNVSESDLRDHLFVRQPSVEDSKVHILYEESVDLSPRNSQLECFDTEIGLKKVNNNSLNVSTHDSNEHKQNESNWLNSNTFISSLYKSPSHSKLGFTSRNTSKHDLLSLKHADISVRLDPSDIFSEMEDREEYEYDLSERFADTVGPRDILIGFDEGN